MKWTNEKITKLIELRHRKMSYADISNILGCSLDGAKKQGAKLIKEGRLARAGDIPKYTRAELIAIVTQFVVKDDCPMEYRHYIREEFGSWGNALKAANLNPNCGGIWDHSKQATLYLLKFDKFYKVGITQRDLKQRFAGAPRYTVLDTYTSDIEEVILLEKEILSKVDKVIPENIWFERNGKTECFTAKKDIVSLLDLI